MSVLFCKAQSLMDAAIVLKVYDTVRTTHAKWNGGITKLIISV